MSRVTTRQGEPEWPDVLDALRRHEFSPVFQGRENVALLDTPSRQRRLNTFSTVADATKGFGCGV